MSKEEEQRFLERLYQKAEQEELITAKEMKRVYKERIGRIVYKTTISDLLKRHGWRKIVPRRKHPKSEKESQETFKKTFQQS